MIGLGYAGLPVALAFARRFPGTLGYDHDAAKVARLARGEDDSGQAKDAELTASELRFTADPVTLAEADFFVVAVPTPVDAEKRPDLGALRAASRTVGEALRPGAIVVYESTVYPGVTEEICAPILEAASGLVRGRDFKVGYSPERINPGDREHRFERITKVVAAEDAETLEIVAACYDAVVEVGVYRAPSIRVAEAGKAIENVQRDLNIALVNEVAILCDRLELDTREVLETAATKWNWHPFRPGLVGGHCIGVDPYYLTSLAEEVGIQPQVILAGRRINDAMSAFLVERIARELEAAERSVAGARVAILGLTYKENVRDLRNSRVPEVRHGLAARGAKVLVYDPLADRAEARREYEIELVERDALVDLDAVVLAVAHDGLAELALELTADGPGGASLFDAAWGIDRDLVPPGTPFGRL